MKRGPFQWTPPAAVRPGAIPSTTPGLAAAYTILIGTLGIVGVIVVTAVAEQRRARTDETPPD